MADNARTYPPRFQFEPSSGTLQYSQTNNCGPTGAAQQIDYYLGRKEGTTAIEPLRAAIGKERGTPTSAWDQMNMLIVKGIPASVISFDSMRQLNRLLGWNGDRPIGIGLMMSRLKPSTRGHSFLGWHRITLIKRARRLVNGRRRYGYLYTDPNFSPPGGYRPDPKKGHRFVTQAELKHAWLDNPAALGIVPNRRKR